MAAPRNRAARAAARDARAKAARAFINRTVPALLRSNARARRGVEAAEVIVDPPPFDAAERDGDGISKHKKAPPPPPPPMRITLRVADTLEAARRLSISSSASPPPRRCSRAPRVAVLNMASPLRPGGGVLTGATSQEESLCARTTLYPSLRESFYRLPDVGGVFTPDVLVCRAAGEGAGAGADLPPSGRFFVDVVTAAMLRAPDVERRGGGGGGPRVYAEQRDRELARRKMRAVMRILRRGGAHRVVLGAWGCGAHGNPVGEVARAWRAVLCGGGRPARRAGDGAGGREGWDGLQVVFAITDASMAAAFAEAFGPGIVVEGEGEDDEHGDGRVSREDGEQDRGRDDEEQHPE